MFDLYRKKRLAFITFAYWFLLFYIVAALAWWFIELWQMNQAMYAFKLELLRTGDPAFEERLQSIMLERERKAGQFIGEGITFLFITLLAALFVYRAMRKQIRLNEQQQNFMMAVTHELKTPIAVTKLNLETLKRHRLDETQSEKLIIKTLQETNRLNDLCNNILLSSQLEAGGFTLNMEENDLAEIITSIVREFNTRFPKRSIKADIPENIRIEGDRFLLQLAINNLIENALKYTADDRPIEVSAVSSTGSVEISVKDQGPGIPDQEKKHVFAKFYRVGTESTRQTKGTGLGLYLTRKIVEDHRGKIFVKDNIPSGCIFVIDLPKKSS